MRHVVERAAHRGNQPFDLVEHRVEQRRQLVERVAGARQAGTRASVRPVRMICRTACVNRRIGKSADCVTSQPPVSAITTIEQRHDARAPRETAPAASSRASVLFPTCTSVPSASWTDAVSRLRRIPAFGVAEDDRFDAAVDRHGRTIARAPRCCSARTVSASSVDAAAQVRGRVVAELALEDLRSRCASDIAVR